MIEATKPGIQTSEFWATALKVLFSAVLSLAALFGHPINNGTVQAVQESVIPGVALVTAGIVVRGYQRSRTIVKTAQLATNGGVTSAAPPAGMVTTV